MEINDLNKLVSEHLPTNILYVHFKYNNGVYVQSTAIYVGKIKVASFHYDNTMSRTEVNKLYYKAVCNIDSLNIQTSRHATEQNAALELIKIAEKYIQQLMYKP